MERQRTRMSRPRRRCEPLIAKPSTQDSSESDTAREVVQNTAKMVRPKTASSRNSSGARARQNITSGHSSSEAETDSGTIVQPISKSSRRSSSVKRSVQEDEHYYSSFDSTGTETDTETLKPYSPKDCDSLPLTPTIVNDEEEYPSDFESEDVQPAAAEVVPEPEMTFLLPPPPIDFCDVRSIEKEEEEYSSSLYSDGAETVITMAPKAKRSASAVLAKLSSKNETLKVPALDLEDLESVSGKSGVTLKSTHGCTNLKQQDQKRREPSESRIGKQLKRIDPKTMSFFPSKNLTRQSIESIYGPSKKPTPIQKRTSNSSVDRAKTQKRNLEKDTPRLPPSKDASKSPEPEMKNRLAKDASKSPEPERKNQPKILQPLLTKTRSDRRVDRMRPTEPVKPLPFKPSGCGKGIPPLANLPKPKLGRIPSFILNKKIEAGGVKLKSASLSTLGNKDLRPAIPSAISVIKETPGTPINAKTPSTSTINNSVTNLSTNKTPDDLFKRNKIPLRKPGCKSTSNLLFIKALSKKEPPALKPKKSVTFEVPPTTASEVQVEKETIPPPPPPPFTTYTDESRKEYKKYLEKLPVFDDGPLPITEPSKIYLRIKNIGWDFSRFTTTDRTKTQGTIPYDFLNEYLPMFQNNLERAAVHIKYGTVADCTCEQPGPSTAFCEKHIDPTKLQWFEEMTNIMVSVLAFKYELAEYEEAEKMLEEKYPYIYQGWVLKMGGALSMDFRVREARCKSELVNRCKRVLAEEQLLAEYLGSQEKIGQKRNIRLSGRMKQLEQEFETSYMFLFSEYPHLFIQLVEKIEFMPLALERRIVCVRRGQILRTANMDEDKLQEIEETYRRKLET